MLYVAKLKVAAAALAAATVVTGGGVAVYQVAGDDAANAASAAAVAQADPAKPDVKSSGKAGNGIEKQGRGSEYEWYTADAPLDNKTPWGDSEDGLACRLVLNEDYCDGEPVRAFVEIRNVSTSEITLPRYFCFDATNAARLEVVGPDGQSLPIPRAKALHMLNFAPSRFGVLAPDAVWRIEFPDIRRHVKTHFEKRGTYQLAYVYYGAKFLGNAPAKEQAARSWKGVLRSSTATIHRSALTAEDLRVHEWGVFSITSDLKYANAGRKAEWASMPDFFYRQFPTQRLRWVPACVDKPIIYFHTSREHLQIEVNVEFSQGAPVVWWPACIRPVDTTGGRPSSKRTGPPFTSLTWSIWLGETYPWTAGNRPVGGYRWPAKPAGLPKQSWLQRARDVKEAATVMTYGTIPGQARFPAPHVETERFIYYDGLVPRPDYLRCTSSEPQRTTLKNTAGFPLRDLFVVDRRGRDTPVRFAHLERLAPDREWRVAFQDVAADDWPRRGRSAVVAALQHAGLLQSEATALADVWTKAFFLTDGLTAFHLLPQSEYDRMLPLKITPAPPEIARVGVALHSHLEGEPAMQERARQLLLQLDDDDFSKREAAGQALGRMGPIAFRLLRETMQTTKSAEVQRRCRLILESVDATTYLEEAARETGIKE